LPTLKLSQIRKLLQRHTTSRTIPLAIPMCSQVEPLHRTLASRPRRCRPPQLSHLSMPSSHNAVHRRRQVICAIQACDDPSVKHQYLGDQRQTRRRRIGHQTMPRRSNCTMAVNKVDKRAKTKNAVTLNTVREFIMRCAAAHLCHCRSRWHRRRSRLRRHY
jgi:hypothetical protein